MQEIVSVGLGSTPFLDIKPSDAALSDQAAEYNMNGTGKVVPALPRSALPAGTQAPERRGGCCRQRPWPVFLRALSGSGVEAALLKQGPTACFLSPSRVKSPRIHSCACP